MALYSAPNTYSCSREVGRETGIPRETGTPCCCRAVCPTTDGDSDHLRGVLAPFPGSDLVVDWGIRPFALCTGVLTIIWVTQTTVALRGAWCFVFLRLFEIGESINFVNRECLSDLLLNSLLAR